MDGGIDGVHLNTSDLTSPSDAVMRHNTSKQSAVSASSAPYRRMMSFKTAIVFSLLIAATAAQHDTGER
jgi:hypothetical protein